MIKNDLHNELKKSNHTFITAIIKSEGKKKKERKC